jgi:hypothetical protein
MDSDRVRVAVQPGKAMTVKEMGLPRRRGGPFPKFSASLADEVVAAVSAHGGKHYVKCSHYQIDDLSRSHCFDPYVAY